MSSFLPIRGFVMLALGWLGAMSALAAVPRTVCIQGVLTGVDAKPLTGDRTWRVQYYDAESGGAMLGAALNGTLTVADSGRWAISLTPPAAVLSSAGEVWYELAIDSAATPDGAIDPGDVFPARIRVESVLFAQKSADTEQLDGMAADEFVSQTDLASVLVDLATTGSLASGLAGKADLAHLHDDRYYTEPEVDATLAAGMATKSDTGHGHNLQSLGGAVTDAQVPDTITINEAAYAAVAGEAGHAAIADSASTAAIALALASPSEPSDAFVTSGTLSAALAGKSDLAHLHDARYYTEAESDAALAVGLATKSDFSHLHDSRYYTEAESDTALAAGLSTKSDLAHGHNLQNLGGAVTDAQVPDDITVDEAAHAAAADEAVHADNADKAGMADMATTASAALSLAGDAADDYATTGALTAGLATKSDTAHGHNLQALGGAVTDAQVPNNITINQAAHAATADVATTALVALALVDGAPANEAFHALTADHAALADVALALDGDAADDYATTGALASGLAVKSDTGHLHDERYYTEGESDAALATKSNAGHLHDGRYYTEGESDAALATKSDVGHGHALQDLSGAVADAQVPDTITVNEAAHAAAADEADHAALADKAGMADMATTAGAALSLAGDAADDYVTTGALAGGLAAKSETSHLHDDRYYMEGEVDAALATGLATKSDLAHLHDNRYYTETESDAALATGLATKSNLAHLHDNRYYTETESDAALATKSEVSHGHNLQDLSGAVTDAQVPDGITVDEAAHAATADAAAHAAAADLATTASVALSLAGDAADDYVTTGVLAAELAVKSATGHLHDDRYYTETEVDTVVTVGLATKADTVHGHALQDLSGAVTDAQVPNDITIDEAAHAAAADLATTATKAAMADMATTAAVALSLAGVSLGDYVTQTEHATDLAGKSDTGHGHALPDLSGAVTDAQVPNDITIDEAAHAATADLAAHAATADLAAAASSLTGDAADDYATTGTLAAGLATKSDTGHGHALPDLSGAVTDAQVPNDITIDEAAHAAAADLAAAASSLTGDAADDYATTGTLASGLATKSDTGHGHALPDLSGAVTDAQVPNDITVDEAAHAAAADLATTATKAAMADMATTATVALSLAGVSIGDYVTQTEHTTDLAGKSDTGHGHALQDLSGAVTDGQVPDDITIDEAAHAAAADLATMAEAALTLAGDAADDYATTGSLVAGLATKSDTGHGHDLPDLGGAVTDAQVPDTITVNEASHAAMADLATTATKAGMADMATTATVALSLAGVSLGDYVTQTQHTTDLADKSDTTHLHDDRYHTETESDAALAAGLATKSDLGHGHNLQDLGGAVTDAQVPDTITVNEAAHAAAADLAAAASSLTGDAADDYATTGSLSAGLATKSDAGHGHNLQDLGGAVSDAQVPDTITVNEAAHAAAADLATTAAIALALAGDAAGDFATTGALTAGLAAKSDTGHGHNLQDLGGVVTDAQVPDDITITEADTLDSVTGRGATTVNGIAVATVDTGQGANELYGMDQNVRTTDDVAFNSVDAAVGSFGTNSVTIDDNVILTGGGKIGIGTTSPTGQIEVSSGLTADQSNLTGTLPWAAPGGSRAAQVFKAGKTGSLARAVLSLRHNGTPTTVEVSIVSGGSPGLGSAASSAESFDVTDGTLTEYTVDFSVPADVIKSQKYHILVKNTGSNIVIWGHTNTNPYSDGAIWILNASWTEQPSSDAVFTTYMADGAFMVDGQGRVGIGTVTPDEALDVTGAIKLPDIIAPPATTSARIYNKAGDLYWGNTQLNRGLHYAVLTTTTSGTLTQAEATAGDGVSETAAIHGTALIWSAVDSKIIAQTTGVYRVTVHSRVQSSGSAGFASFHQRIKIGGATQTQTANTIKTAAGMTWSAPVSMEWIGTISQNQSVQCAIDSEDIFGSGSTPDPVAFGPGTVIAVVKLD
jgi:hypothetical protein